MKKKKNPIAKALKNPSLKPKVIPDKRETKIEKANIKDSLRDVNES